MNLDTLAENLEGELHSDNITRALYATDASAYREMPQAVAFPKNKADIRKLIQFAKENQTSLIPRTAGTSLAGQVVGGGIVVDVSRTFTQILEVNEDEKWVRVQPGVIRDELNLFLAKYGLFFGPETSTANRAMIGGMVGNNSSGARSLVYGTTRESLLEVKGFLSDGSEVAFGELCDEEFDRKCNAEEETLEKQIYLHIRELLSNPENRQEIRNGFPKTSIKRRNTGYAIDLLARTCQFSFKEDRFNFCKLIAGSEGTLMFITEIKLHCEPLPPKHTGLLCVHCHSIDEALRANIVALEHAPMASELMDDYILDRTKENREQRQNRFFVKGEPKAILVVEIAKHTEDEMLASLQALEKNLRQKGFGYDYPIVTGSQIKKVWTLRKAGLGLLSNVPGDAKPVPVIEDTAVDVNDLPDYIAEFNKITQAHGLHCVHYAHAGAGELHLRPVIDLKTEEGNKMFRLMADEIAKLVKKYQGSLSGEHGDGRLRGEYICFMLGERNYQFCKDIKQTWDPKNIFNPGKIVDTPQMDSSLRFMPGIETPDIETTFDFSNVQGYLRAAEFCNGSGDCRKTELSGGTMCPSYMATRNEKNTTRARANILREFIRKPFRKNPFNHPEIYEVMDLCLSCKACKSECPSNVDVTKLKAEFLQQYYEANGVPFRAWLIANFNKINKFASLVPQAYNYLASHEFFASVIKNISGFAQQRSLPKLHNVTLSAWFKKHVKVTNKSKKQVFLFNDEFTNFNDTPIGIICIELLERLGYEVQIPQHIESGRTYLSKGLVKKAKEIAIKNIELLKEKISEETPLLGIEPSAILTFRDEYVELVPLELRETARNLARNSLLIDEFIAQEIENGNISSELFTEKKQRIKIHGHCHQKALASLEPTRKMLTLPKNYEVEVIPSGCCGMAGSFGYEEEHYEVSMQVAELVLLPAVRNKTEETIITAPGTSCRHQIKDGTGVVALHPVEILHAALK